MEGFLTLRQRHSLRGATITKQSPFIGRPIQDPQPGDAYTVFAPSSALTDDSTNINYDMNIRIVVPITQSIGSEFRITLLPAVSGDPLTCLHVALGRDAGDPLYPSMLEAPVEALYSGAQGFSSATTAKTSDWMPSGSMNGMSVGSLVTVSLSTGPTGEAGFRYGTVTNATSWMKNAPANWDKVNVVGDAYVSSPNTAIALILIESRSVLGAYPLPPLGYQKAPPIIPAAVLTTYFRAALVAENFTRSSPTFLMVDSLVQVSVKKNLIAASFTKSAPVLAAPGSNTIRQLTATLTKASPMLGAPALVRKLDITAASLTKIAPTLPAPLSGMKHLLGSAGFTRGAITFPNTLTFDDPANYANGEIAPEGYHWEFLTDDTGVRITDDNGQYIVDLVAD